MINDAIEMGASRKAGVEKGIRNELNNLLNRKKSRKFLSNEDVAAIRKVTDGDFKQNFASMVGGMGLKLENSPSLLGGLVGGGGVGAIASTIPGLGGAIAPIAVAAITVGTISKEIAKKMTKSRAQFLKTMSGAGNDAQKITRAYLRAVPKGQRVLSDLSDLLLDPDIDLSTLENIADETVKDAVKAAQFKRELLQASIALGASADLEDQKNQKE
jgi:outer membrane lipoprotein SlyB